MTWRFHATALIIFAALSGLCAAGGAAHDQPNDLPNAKAAFDACLVLRDWVESYAPPDPRAPESALLIPNASAACVILRLRGRVFGSGVDATGDDRMIRRAAARAMGEVLGHESVVRLEPAVRDGIGKVLSIELEIAGPLIPMPGRTFEEIAEQLEPGLDGIAMRRDAEVAYLFPSQMRSTGAAARLEGALPGLAADLGLTAMNLPTLRNQHGVQVYRFRTVNFAQRAPGRAPLPLTRGETLVSPEDVTPERMTRVAEGLVTHLITSLWPHDEPLGLLGDYHPIADRYQPLVASPRDQALAAFALARCAKIPQMVAVERERARSTAEVILIQLTAVDETAEVDPLSDPTACAAIVYAVTELDAAPLEDEVIALFREAAARVRAQPMTARPALGPHAQALLAGACARLVKGDLDKRLNVVAGENDRAHAREALDAAWASVSPQQQIALLPWIGWGEADLASAQQADPEESNQVDRLIALRALIDIIRIGSERTPGPAELAGGYALSYGGRVSADAQTTRPAAWYASAIRSESITPANDAPVAMERHLATIRFLMQLAVFDDDLWWTPTPQRAKYGICASLWQNDQPAAAQAMALLTFAETLISMDQLGSESNVE